MNVTKSSSQETLLLVCFYTNKRRGRGYVTKWRLVRERKGAQAREGSSQTEMMNNTPDVKRVSPSKSKKVPASDTFARGAQTRRLIPVEGGKLNEGLACRTVKFRSPEKPSKREDIRSQPPRKVALSRKEIRGAMSSKFGLGISLGWGTNRRSTDIADARKRALILLGGEKLSGERRRPRKGFDPALRRADLQEEH